MPEIQAIKDKVKNIKNKLKKRIFNNQKILPGMKESLIKIESDKQQQRIKEFGITNSSFFNSERNFEGSISKDSFYNQRIGVKNNEENLFKKRFNSLERDTTRKHVYRLLKSGYGVTYFRKIKNEKKRVLRRRDSVDGRIKKRKNLAQSFY